MGKQNRHIILSCSGGKDSTAAGLWLMEKGLDFDPVFMDTGWEHPATLEYLGYLEGVFGKSIKRLQGTFKGEPASMVSIIRAKGMFPSRTARFCTQLLKVKPMHEHCLSLPERPVCVVGVRAAESRKRAAMPMWEESLEASVYRPLLLWSFDDVAGIHKRHGVRPNPLYMNGANRVGCFPCLHANKAEIALLPRLMPERVALLRELEKEITEVAKRRFADKNDGAILEYPRTFFSGRGPADLGGRSMYMGIDDVIEWSTTTNGRQFSLLDPPEDAGCMRWGLCDTGFDRKVGEDG